MEKSVEVNFNKQYRELITKPRISQAIKENKPITKEAFLICVIEDQALAPMIQDLEDLDYMAFIGNDNNLIDDVSLETIYSLVRQNNYKGVDIIGCGSLSDAVWVIKSEFTQVDLFLIDIKLNADWGMGRCADNPYETLNLKFETKVTPSSDDILRFGGLFIRVEIENRAHSLEIPCPISFIYTGDGPTQCTLAAYMMPDKYSSLRIINKPNFRTVFPREITPVLSAWRQRIFHQEVPKVINVISELENLKPPVSPGQVAENLETLKISDCSFFNLLVPYSVKVLKGKMIEDNVHKIINVLKEEGCGLVFLLKQIYEVAGKSNGAGDLKHNLTETTNSVSKYECSLQKYFDHYKRVVVEISGKIDKIEKDYGGKSIEDLKGKLLKLENDLQNCSTYTSTSEWDSFKTNAQDVEDTFNRMVNPCLLLVDYFDNKFNLSNKAFAQPFSVTLNGKDFKFSFKGGKIAQYFNNVITSAKPIWENLRKKAKEEKSLFMAANIYLSYSLLTLIFDIFVKGVADYCSQGAEIIVDIVQRNNKWAIRFSDNGHGFDSNGISNIKEKLKFTRKKFDDFKNGEYRLNLDILPILAFLQGIVFSITTNGQKYESRTGSFKSTTHSFKGVLYEFEL